MAEQGYISRAKAASRREADGLGLERGYKYETREQRTSSTTSQQELIDRYGVSTVRQGGLEVYTTIDPQLQAARRAGDRRPPASHPAPRTALVSTDTETGEILAMASSGRPTRTASSTSPRRAAASPARRSSRSCSPTAVDQGIDPDSTYYSAPARSRSTRRPVRAPWTVHAAAASGTMSLRHATANSVNTVYAQLGSTSAPRTSPRWRSSSASPARARRLPRPGARRHRPGLAARDVERLRDDRQRRRPPRPDRDRAGSSSPTARSTSPRTTRGQRGWSATASPTRSPT